MMKSFGSTICSLKKIISLILHTNTKSHSNHNDGTKHHSRYSSTNNKMKCKCLHRPLAVEIKLHCSLPSLTAWGVFYSVPCCDKRSAKLPPSKP